jgi:hypothetical protein
MATIIVTDKPTVKVELDLLAQYNSGNYYSGEFGFDTNTPTQVKNAKVDYKNTLADAYMSFINGQQQQSAKMKMEVIANSFPKDYEIEIKANNLTITPNKFTAKELEKAKKEEENIKFTILPNNVANNDKLQVIGRYGSTEEILYEINYSVKDKKDLVKRKLILLYVVAEDKDLGKNIDEVYRNDVANQLNNYSYNQTHTEWEIEAGVVDIRDSISKSLRLQEMYNSYKEISDSYTDRSNPELRNKLNQLLRKYGYLDNQFDKYVSDCNPNIPIFSLMTKITSTNVHTEIMHDLFEIYTNKYEKSYLSFIFDRSSFSNEPATVPGVASLYKSIFLFSRVRNNLSVFTHELGHSLGLKHPFEEFGTPYANTLNYMDYGRANMFWFWQWNFIQNAKFPGDE